MVRSDIFDAHGRINAILDDYDDQISGWNNKCDFIIPNIYSVKESLQQKLKQKS